MPPWSPDIEIDAWGAARLIEDQFPALAPARLEPLGVGWDNSAYLVNGEWVFRFPRREFFAHLTAREARILPRLAAHLPLPIPEPVLVGEPSAGYPWGFAGYRFLPGVPACGVEWTDDARTRCALPLARFLRAVHGIPVDAATLAEGPGDEIHRADMRRRLPLLREQLEAFAAAEAVDARPVRALMEELAETPGYSGRPCWVHGDLYARHLLVDASLTPCGVIDWGDVHLGDPALDLSLAVSFLPASSRGAFCAEYGPIDPNTWRRARFRALFYGIVLTHFALDTGDAALRSAGLYALRAAT